MSAESFRADQIFPHLEVARDPEWMREVFQKHLQPLGERAYQIRECRIFRIRYWQGSRCMLHTLYAWRSPTRGASGASG